MNGTQTETKPKNRNNSPLRRIRNASLAAIFWSTATILIVSWMVAGALIAPVTENVGQPPEDLPIQSIILNSANGNSIHGWHIQNNQHNATIILLHPLRSDRRSMLNRARLCHQQGYSVMLFDLQAHGESPGQHITFGFREASNVKAIVDHVRKQYPDHRIGVIGRSLGGAATILSGVDVDAVVLESVYGNIETAVHNRVAMRIGPLHHLVAPLLIWQLQPRLGISPSQLRPEDHIADLNCPVMVAAGDIDRHTTLAETQQLYSAAQRPKNLVIFIGASHEDLLEFDPKKYRQTVLEFLRAHLLQP